MNVKPRNLILITGQKAIIGYQLDILPYIAVKHHKLINETKKPVIIGNISKEAKFKQVIKDLCKKLTKGKNILVLGKIYFYIQNCKGKLTRTTVVRFACYNDIVDFLTSQGLKTLDYNYNIARLVMGNERTFIGDVKLPPKYPLDVIGIADRQIMVSDRYNATIHRTNYNIDGYIISERDNDKIKVNCEYISFELIETDIDMYKYCIIVKDKFKDAIIGFYIAKHKNDSSSLFNVVKDKGNDQLTFTAYIRDNQIDIANVASDYITLHYIPRTQMIRFSAQHDGYEATAYAKAHIDKLLTLDNEHAYLIGTFRARHLKDAVKYRKLTLSLCDYDGRGYNLHKKAFLDYETAVLPVEMPEYEYFGDKNVLCPNTEED